jgi:hypothetical protein
MINLIKNIAIIAFILTAYVSCIDLINSDIEKEKNEENSNAYRLDENALRVDPESTATNPDGKTWATAYRNLPDLIDLISHANSEKKRTIALKQGVHNISSTIILANESVEIKNIEIIGGYLGKSNTGDDKQKDASKTILKIEKDKNAIIAHYNKPKDINVLLDNFTIADVRVGDNFTIADWRAGVDRSNGGSVTIKNTDSSFVMKNIVFSHNSILGLLNTENGAVLNIENSQGIFDSISFNKNYSYKSPARFIFIKNSKPEIKNISMIENEPYHNFGKDILIIGNNAQDLKKAILKTSLGIKDEQVFTKDN